jgi:mRNA interferase RelE/StbE
MASYEVVFKASVSKDLRPLPRKDVQRILDAIRSLAANPRPPQSRKLAGEDKYRLRCGDYRILYQIEDRILTVCVVKVGHRKDVYRS